MKTKLISEEKIYELTKDKKYKVMVRITDKNIEIDKPFIFKSKRSQETIDRWVEVVGMLVDVIKFIEKQI